MRIKEGIRILCIDDSPPVGKRVLIVGVVSGKKGVEGIVSTKITKDGWNASDRIIGMVEKSRFKEQIKLVFLHSLMMGGFNVVDVEKLYGKLKIPVICIARRKPDMERVERALSFLKNHEKKLDLIKKAKELEMEYYYQYFGCRGGDLRRAIGIFGKFPEGLRLAHLIAGGIVRGESKGKA